MGQEILEAHTAAKSNAVIGALSPFGEFFIERVPLGGDLIAQRLEQAPQHHVSAPAGNRGDAGFE